MIDDAHTPIVPRIFSALRSVVSFEGNLASPRIDQGSHDLHTNKGANDNDSHLHVKTTIPKSRELAVPFRALPFLGCC